MSDLTKIGTSLLEMDDIAEYLDIAKKFVTKNQIENAPVENKVTKVAGIPVTNLAYSVDGDRKTINNSMHLEGHPASYFMTANAGNSVVTNLKDTRTAYNSELKELRDEVYQLREELAKSGTLVGYKPYAGFYDMFRNNQPMHEADIMGKCIQDSATQYDIKIKDLEYVNFAEGDYVMLRSLVDGNTAFAMIEKKQPDGETLTLDRATGFNILKDKCVIYKSKGNVINGTFTFGEITPERPGTKSFYTGLDDDTYVKKWTSIDTKHTGVGYTFRIPQHLQKNFLAQVNIQVRKYGNPGDLTCYIIDERDMDRWKNPDQAIADNDKESKAYKYTKYHFFAKSQPLHVDGSYGMHIESFTFYDPTAGDLAPITMADLTPEEIATLTPEERSALDASGVIMKRNQSSYPLLTEVDETNHPVRYCMIIEAADADDDNRYELLLLQNRINKDGDLGDLELNNILYKYERKESSSKDPALVTNEIINAADLFYGVTLVEAVHEVFTPYDEGVYSAHFQTHEPVRLTKGRLMLRIAREGMFTIDPDGTSTIGDMGDGGVVAVKGESLMDVDGFTGSKGNNVVIGTEFRTIENVAGNKLTVQKGLPVSADDIVYPIGYKVAINAKLKIWDPEKCKTVIKRTQRFELPLVTIMPDQYKQSRKISDRLIFESLFDNASDVTRQSKEQKEKVAKEVQDKLRRLQQLQSSPTATKDDIDAAQDAYEKQKKAYQDWLDEVHEFNDFEVQIVWEKSCKQMNTNLCGRIHDLVLSLDRSQSES